VLLIVRSRLWVVAISLAGLLAAAAWLASQFIPRQPHGSAGCGLSFIRGAVPFLALCKLQDLLAREIDRRLILTTLTYPRSAHPFCWHAMRHAAVRPDSTVLLFLVLAGVVTLQAPITIRRPRFALGFPT